jgi:hypothetical protein
MISSVLKVSFLTLYTFINNEHTLIAQQLIETRASVITTLRSVANKKFNAVENNGS